MKKKLNSVFIWHASCKDIYKIIAFLLVPLFCCTQPFYLTLIKYDFICCGAGDSVTVGNKQNLQDRKIYNGSNQYLDIQNA